jgi:hypothetical protein
MSRRLDCAEVTIRRMESGDMRIPVGLAQWLTAIHEAATRPPPPWRRDDLDEDEWDHSLPPRRATKRLAREQAEAMMAHYREEWERSQQEGAAKDVDRHAEPVQWWRQTSR